MSANSSLTRCATPRPKQLITTWKVKQHIANFIRYHCQGKAAVQDSSLQTWTWETLFPTVIQKHWQRRAATPGANIYIYICSSVDLTKHARTSWQNLLKNIKNDLFTHIYIHRSIYSARNHRTLVARCKSSKTTASIGLRPTLAKLQQPSCSSAPLGRIQKTMYCIWTQWYKHM